MQALCDGEPVAGPVEHFVKLSPALEATIQATEPEPIEARGRKFAEERLIAEADGRFLGAAPSEKRELKQRYGMPVELPAAGARRE